MELGPILFILLVVGFNFLRKKMEQANLEAKRRRAAEAAQAGRKPMAYQPQPVSFPEAAPAAPDWQDDNLAPGSLHQYEPRLESSIQKENLSPTLPAQHVELAPNERGVKPAAKAKPVARAAHPLPGVLPALNAQSLVQAVIAKEILTRPPSAAKPYGRPGSRRTAGV